MTSEEEKQFERQMMREASFKNTLIWMGAIVATVFMLLGALAVHAIESREEARIKADAEVQTARIAHGCK